MSQLSPHTVLSQVAAAVPENCRHHIIIIGSLAALAEKQRQGKRWQGFLKKS